MQNESGLIQVEATSRFQRKVKSLAKEYRSIQADVSPIIKQLEAGEHPGDQVPDIGYEVYKVRIKNSDIQKGKSRGYRLLYYIKTNTRIILLTLYAKSEQVDITAQVLPQSVL